ncbi:unnamed protein product, partial [marine sediment metagenome]
LFGKVGHECVPEEWYVTNPDSMAERHMIEGRNSARIETYKNIDEWGRES